MTAFNSFVQMIHEINEQKTALQTLIQEKEAEILALQAEIPELQAQMIGLDELYDNATRLNQITNESSSSSNSIVYSSSTIV